MSLENPTPQEQFRMVGTYAPGSNVPANGEVLTWDGTNRFWYPNALATAPTEVPKGADETVNNSNTLQNDDALLFTAVANTVYRVRLVIRYNSGGTPDIKFAWSLPAGATIVRASVGYNTAATATLTISASSAAHVAGATGPGNDDIYVEDAIITVAGTAGACTVQWAQNTADASDTKVLEGSSLTYVATA